MTHFYIVYISHSLSLSLSPLLPCFSRLLTPFELCCDLFTLHSPSVLTLTHLLCDAGYSLRVTVCLSQAIMGRGNTGQTAVTETSIL